MNEDVQQSGVRRVAGYIIFWIALVMALTGIANSAPSFWIIPTIGPFPSEMIRPIILAASVIVVILKYSFTDLLTERSPALKPLGLLIDVVLVLASWWVFWRYFVDVSEMEIGLFDFTIIHPAIALTGCAMFIIICWRVWGSPLAICGIVAIIYLYTGHYWPWIFETAPVIFIDSSEDLWFNLNDGVLGTIMGILIFTVFPFVLLGVMLERTGGGFSLIKIAFHLTRSFRGGPAHAAILASGLFGTMSGGAVTNVVATGVITIPMIKRRGFHPAFAGGVEATASSAGQIMPPIMGAAALVMADFTGINYLIIIIAALVPALAYYTSLFTSVVFEARRLGVEAVPDMDDADLAVETQDIINLVMIVIPVGIVVMTLIMGFSPAGAGMMALYSIVPLSFANPEIRKDPLLILKALARGGETFGSLLMAIGVVGIIVAVLGTTGLPNDFAQVVNEYGEGQLFITLLIAGLAAIMLGMGMPTLPAYLTIILIMGPSLQGLGVSVLVGHLFVFYYGVASSITPPVAVAAYAAASIAEAPPLMTAVYAIRIGLVKFIVPFAFAFYPVLLIVEESGVPFEFLAFLSAIARLGLVIYLVSSATLMFDQRRLPAWEVVLRLLLAIGALMIDPLIHWPAFAIGIAFLIWHWLQFRSAGSAQPGAAT
ncbi:MAG: TRAP transporter fused permease subunit [Rhodospirillales bacterium]|jgi:TRAP transporter 4TM/12TM fusion protein|nr:TRAP transporter permease DctM/Q [Rhodospirillaceae bacterium]MDP6429461.1 TRAP transporter fused permease subunit [Rhodospirillales bacterium]MDP6645854.1 TRAP transporter fused permease subunit [Rhodospirillales bacterium]